MRINKEQSHGSKYSIKQNAVYSVLIFLVVFGIMMVLYRVFSYAPFGENNLAWTDANFQYVDFFCYFKDVLSGKNNIGYTFGKTLGGNNIAVFSYYLSSPFNFLVVFFDKTEMMSFLDLVIALKLGTAAVTFSVFLRGHFQNRMRVEIVALLSVSYALSQYSIAQSSNVMWLDGVYMLPLILLGIYKLVRQQKMILLSATVGLSILFNWYSGGINCLFSVLWFLFELICFIVDLEGETLKKKLQRSLITSLKYIIAMFLGVLLSACLFLPTIFALQGGRAGVDWFLLDNTLTGSVWSVIQGNTLGAVSASGQVSLFCGSAAVIGCIGFFLLKSVPVRNKVVVGIMLFVTMMLFYWQPFFAVFSLFKSATSYWYRYSYVGILLILFIAAWFYRECRKKIVYTVIIATLVFSVLLIALHDIHPMYSNKRTYATVFLLCIIAISLIWYMKSKNKRFRYISAVVLFVFVAAEMMCNAKLLMDVYSNQNGKDYATYVEQEQKQIAEIQKMDDGNYRISQTSTRSQQANGIITNYNEAIVYNYWSISGYTSDPDNIQREFLDKLGYRINGDNLCVVNTSIVSADTLLGVKYVLSGYPIDGLELVSNTGIYNGKRVYQNPFCLPLAFSYPGSKMNSDTAENHFEYQNLLYSQLTGDDVDIYSPLDYRCIEDKNGYTYQVSVPEGNYAVYGNLVWGNETNALLKVNGIYETAYAQWLSPSVFYIPTKNDENEITVQLYSKEHLSVKDVQFYVLDLNKLKEISQKVKQNSADTLKMENGYLSCKINGSSGENAYISVPYDEGWTILLNGKEIEPELFADCMISIPLEEGTNEIEMTYHVAGIETGIILTLLSILVLTVTGLVTNGRITGKRRQSDETDRNSSVL